MVGRRLAASTSRRTASRRRSTRPSDSDLYAVPATGGEIDEGRRHRRHDRQSVGLAERPLDRVCRHAHRHARALVQSVRSVRGRSGRAEARLRHVRARRAISPRATTSTSAAASAAIRRAARRRVAQPDLVRRRHVDRRSSPASRATPTCCASMSPAASRRRSSRARTPCSRTRRRATASALVALVSTQTNIGDLFVVDMARLKPGSAPSLRRAEQITRINDDLFKTLKLSEPEEVWWTSFDGKKIQGWVLHPPDFDKSKKYPFILEIHGGPHSAYGNIFTHEFHWLAAQGLRRALPEPARQQQLRAGLRQRHPVPLSRRRLQGPDGRRGHDGQARLHRREAHGRHRRQRRRAAHQLDDHADDALRGGGVDAIDRRLVGLLVHGGLLAVHRRPGSARRRGRTRPTTPRARRSRTSRRSRRRSC